MCMGYNRKPIEGYSNYEIDTCGNVFVVKIVDGKKKEKKLKPAILKNGYKQVKLFDGDGKQHGMYVHRLVAIAFLDNTLNKKVVNHKDCNKTNNNIDNLEWATYKENAMHFQTMRRMYKTSPDLVVIQPFSVLQLAVAGM